MAPYVLDTIRPFVETDMKLNAHGFLFVCDPFQDVSEEFRTVKWGLSKGLG